VVSFLFIIRVGSRATELVDCTGQFIRARVRIIVKVITRFPQTPSVISGFEAKEPVFFRGVVLKLTDFDNCHWDAVLMSTDRDFLFCLLNLPSKLLRKGDTLETFWRASDAPNNGQTVSELAQHFINARFVHHVLLFDSPFFLASENAETNFAGMSQREHMKIAFSP